MTEHIYTTKDLADKFHITIGRVRELALLRHVGEKLDMGKRSIYVFRESDIEKMRPKKTGRPTIKKGE